MKGLLVILSSPSGGGKTSVIYRIIEKYDGNFVYSISATTRQPRPGEKNGKDYFFLTQQEFEDQIKKDLLLEWEQVHGYCYGTPKSYVEQAIAAGKFVLLDIDVNGALQIAHKFPQNTLTIFVAPPSLDELIQRLRNRKTDSENEINKRLERIPVEMEQSKRFDYVVINEKLENTVAEIVKIIKTNQKKNLVSDHLE
ncbi:MAG TPA: guanylate kinase [bacterium]